MGQRAAVTGSEALEFVRSNGIVLEAARGPVPALTAFIAAEVVGGNWWAHPQAKRLFALTRAVRDNPEVLVCRVVDGKVTYVHQRLWPALVRVADRFPVARLARIRETHTAAGRHALDEVAFPHWVTGTISAAAARLDEATALAALGEWCQR